MDSTKITLVRWMRSRSNNEAMTQMGRPVPGPLHKTTSGLITRTYHFLISVHMHVKVANWWAHFWIKQGIALRWKNQQFRDDCFQRPLQRKLRYVWEISTCFPIILLYKKKIAASDFWIAKLLKTTYWGLNIDIAVNFWRENPKHSLTEYVIPFIHLLSICQGARAPF